MRSSRSSARLVWCLAVPALAGCGQARPAAVVPGLAVHLDRPAGTDTVVYRRSTTRDGQESATGSRTVVLKLIDAPHRPRLLQVEQRFPAGGGEIIDTAVAEFETMRAEAHQSHQPTRVMRFTFPGADAEGTVVSLAPSGDSVTRVRQPLGGPIFDSNVIDLVVSGLPLRPGFSTELPFFIYERGGRVAIPVEVRERSTVAFRRFGPREVWVVSVGVPGAPATVWVDTRTRAVLRIRYDVSARAMSFTDERVTALHG